MVGVEICQSGDCSRVSLPVSTDSQDLSLSEFDQSFDLNATGSIDVAVTRVSGVVAEASEPFDFGDWQPEGAGCGTHSQQVVEVA